MENFIYRFRGGILDRMAGIGMDGMGLRCEEERGRGGALEIDLGKRWDGMEYNGICKLLMWFSIHGSTTLVGA